MENLLIILKNYQSPGEAFVVGTLSTLLIYGIIAISGAIRRSKERNKKEWEEMTKDKKRDKNGHSTNW